MERKAERWLPSQPQSKTNGVFSWQPNLDDLRPIWQQWLTDFFPHLYYHPFADHHTEFWQHVDSIQSNVKPPAFFPVWARGGAKSSSAEGAAVYLAALNRRKFCLYLRATQDRANESVSNIADMLENAELAKCYPLLTQRKLNKYGHSKGWKINVLRCASGFTVVALGLNAAGRGVKYGQFRPDLIVCDDVDEMGDSLATIEKKISILTSDILPAGSSDAAFIWIQNLIHYNSIIKRVVDGKADFLHDRIVSGPYPAVEGLEYEAREGGGYRITSGTPTWQGQNLETCEKQINEWGLDVFLQEAQHVVSLRKGRVFHGYIKPGPDAKSLDYSKVEGYWHAHDFGGTNEVWGLFVKIEGVYYLIFEQMLPEATTARRAEIVKETIGAYLTPAIERHRNEIATSGNIWNINKRAFESAWQEWVIAGYGGAKSEKQIRADYREAGLEIQPPNVSAVESQINTANEMFEKGGLVICSNCVHTIDHLEHCIRDATGAILNERAFHYAAMIRYFCAGVGGGLHWAR